MFGAVKGKTFIEVLPIDALLRMARRVMQNGPPECLKGCAYRGPQGVRGNVNFARVGKNLVLTIFDVEQLASERDLFADRYRAIVNSLPDTVHLLDQNGLFLDTHIGVTRFDNATPEFYKGNTIYDVFPVPVAHGLLARIHLAIETGATQEWEYTLPEWGDRYIEARVFKVHLSQVGLAEVMLILRDITGRRHAEEDLKETAENFRAAFEDSLAGQFQLNPDGTFRRVNDALVQMLGVSSCGTLLGQQLLDWVYPEDYSKVAEVITQTFALSLDQGGTTRLVTPTNKVIWCDFSIRPVEVDGHVRYSTSTILDVTEKHDMHQRLEQQVEARTAELLNANETIQQFAYTASHDLREPLNKIISFGDRLSLKYESKLDETGLQYLGIMKSAAFRMRALVDDILIYARSNKEESAPSLCSLNVIVQGALSDLEVPISEADAHITVGELPSVMGYPHRLGQLVQNLISNAVKFRHKDVPCHVSITGSELGGIAELRVQDNGIGFDPQYADKIFQAFTRLHTRFEYPGTGIGLALCRKIVAMHGGTIEAVGVPGAGATFVTRIPVQGGTAT